MGKKPKFSILFSIMANSPLCFISAFLLGLFLHQNSATSTNSASPAAVSVSIQLANERFSKQVNNFILPDIPIFNPSDVLDIVVTVSVAKNEDSDEQDSSDPSLNSVELGPAKIVLFRKDKTSFDLTKFNFNLDIKYGESQTFTSQLNVFDDLAQITDCEIALVLSKHDVTSNHLKFKVVEVKSFLIVVKYILQRISSVLIFVGSLYGTYYGSNFGLKYFGLISNAPVTKSKSPSKLTNGISKDIAESYLKNNIHMGVSHKKI